MNKVLFINWDSYPNFTIGGIYFWEKNLITNFTNYEFLIVNVLSNSNTGEAHDVPENVSKVIELPLFGSYRYEEFTKEDRGIVSPIMRTNNSSIKKKFLPLFKNFLDNLISDTYNPKELAKTIFGLHKFQLEHDLKKCMEYPGTWEAFVSKINEDTLYSEMQISEVSTAFKSFQKYMQIFSINIPPVDLVHCSQAWFPSLIASFVKMKYSCPVVVTEHGVALRELMLYYNGAIHDSPSNIFWNRVSSNIVKFTYSIADVITPVCYANAKWEEDLGADPSKINVIYNGVDINRFKPEKREKNERPTVVYVGRIDPWKDIVNLLHAVKDVTTKIPNVKFLLYGTANDMNYALKCVNTVSELHLQNNVKFMGQTDTPEKIYNKADVIVTSSVAEGFPLWLIEAMACGKGIVATNIGGIPEALGGCGLLVKPGHPRELSDAITKLLMDSSLRNKLGMSAIKRVEKNFTLEKTNLKFRDLYQRLIQNPEKLFTSEVRI